MAEGSGLSDVEGMRILVVDDEESNLLVIRRLLEREGFTAVEGVTDPAEGVSRFRAAPPDLLLLDLRMPRMDGFQVMKVIREDLPPEVYLPILILTGDLDPEAKERALRAGARDFITKPFDRTEVILRIRNLLETRQLHLRVLEHADTLEQRVAERTRELARAQVEILNRLALAAEYRDDITGRHAERVGVLASLLGEKMGQEEGWCRLLRRAATLHDLGKIGIPDAILMKPGPLTPPEYELMKAHTQIGARILSGSSFPMLQLAREIAEAHHERWDGRGYQGLAGETIPLSGRIVAVADVFDSLTHHRPYKQPVSQEEARAEVERGSGTHFDPEVVQAFRHLVEEGALDNLDELARESMAED